MVKIANKPIIYHIMKLYAQYGFKDFYMHWIQGDVISNFKKIKKLECYSCQNGFKNHEGD